MRLLFARISNSSLLIHEKEPDIRQLFLTNLSFTKIKLRALHSAGSQAACTHMQLFVCAIHFAFHVLNVGIPDSV